MTTDLKLMQNFAANLELVRTHKGLSKSDLAREIWGTYTDSRGYTAAKNRDRIGAWESGRATPTPENLALLSEALDIDANLLAPDLMARAASNAPEAFSLRVLANDPEKAHLRVNTILPTETAVKVMGLLSTSGAEPAEDEILE